MNESILIDLLLFLHMFWRMNEVLSTKKWKRNDISNLIQNGDRDEGVDEDEIEEIQCTS